MTDCIFCKIAGGQIQTQAVYESRSVLAFRDVNPQAPVHVLVIPKKHIERLSTLMEDDLPLVAEIARAIQDVAKKENVSDDGFRVVTNDGKNGGQTVPHLHFHVLGGRRMTWPPG